ncbi:MAG: methyltransferase domain-containing protein [Gammaproteobacteria bacterium]|nr:methyltransferase domain-containing protein [Gammaproteobacteria bacterium]MCP5201552.1 methyltransferase domain-containing protein [Gammaproteobacteria bacterium]
MDTATQGKWDRTARIFDFMTGRGPERRWGPAKRRLFAHMQGRILFLALGTGLDIACFPPGQTITAIDISPEMLAKAAPRVAAYDGDIEARVMDVHELDMDDASFDQVYTSCTFCSVPDPVGGLRQLYRVLKPGGDLYMFEHTGSRFFPFNLMLHLMTPMTRLIGPDLDRPTVANVRAAGFEVRAVEYVYLDVVKTIHAVRPAP